MWPLLLLVKDRPKPALRLLLLEQFWQQARLLFACALACMLPLPYNIAIVGTLTITVLAVSLILAVFRIERTRSLPDLLAPAPVLVAMAALFLLYLVGMAWAAEPAQAGFGVEKKLSFIALPLAFMLAPATKRFADGVTFSFVIGMLVVVMSVFAIALLRYSREPHAYLFFGAGSLYPLELHHAYIGIFGLFAAVAAWQAAPAWGPRWLRVALAGTLALFSVLMVSRTGLVLMLVLGLGYALLYAARGKLIRGLVAILLFGGTVALLWQVPYVRQTLADMRLTRDIPQPEDVRDADGVATRYYIWRINLALAQRIPWYGLGTNSTTLAQAAAYKSVRFMGDAAPHYNAHNQYLQTFLELGWPGLACLCLLFGLAIYLGLATQLPMLTAIGAIACTACLTEAWLDTHKGILFIAVFLAVHGSHKVNNE